MRTHVLTWILAFALAGTVTRPLIGQKASTAVPLKDAQGHSVGTATLSATATGGVSIALDLENLL
jgi:hypothetical protein